jgi:hypothetical protein
MSPEASSTIFIPSVSGALSTYSVNSSALKKSNILFVETRDCRMSLKRGEREIRFYRVTEAGESDKEKRLHVVKGRDPIG